MERPQKEASNITEFIHDFANRLTKDINFPILTFPCIHVFLTALMFIIHEYHNDVVGQAELQSYSYLITKEISYVIDLEGTIWLYYFSK